MAEPPLSAPAVSFAAAIITFAVMEAKPGAIPPSDGLASAEPLLPTAAAGSARGFLRRFAFAYDVALVCSPGCILLAIVDKSRRPRG